MSKVRSKEEKPKEEDKALRLFALHAENLGIGVSKPS